MNQRGGYASRGRGQQSKQHGGNVRKRNLVDADEYIAKCIICKSIFHWTKDCPDIVLIEDERNRKGCEDI